MFASKVAKPQKNAVESPTSELTDQHSTLGWHRLGHDPVEPTLALQRTIGNQATLGFLAHQAPRPAGCPAAGEQAVNPNQSHEQAAERTAEHVLHMSASAADRDAVSGAQPLDPPAGIGMVPTSGEPLDAATRAFMEPRFRYNFANVRVHADPDSASSARELAANAYTVGPHIVFAANRFVPGTQAGRRLLAHELAHVVQQAHGVSPVMVQCDEAVPADPWAKLSAAAAQDAQAVWDHCDESIDQLTEAQMVHQSATRSAWLNTLRAHRAAIEAADSDAKLTAAKTAYHAHDRQLNSAVATYQMEWAELVDRYRDEHSWLLSRTVKSTDSIEAAKYLETIYRTTAPAIPFWVAADDYLELKHVLANQEYIRVGALRGARIRSTQLFQIMRTVADLRRRGEDAEKFIPEWTSRVAEEATYLESFATLASGAGRDYAAELTDLRKRLLAEQQHTMKVKASTTALDKGAALVTGAVETVAGIFVEAAKQAVDLAQINLHVLTLGGYDPSFISDTAKAAEQGATTTDLLMGMITGMIDTPSRFLTACRDGDWEAIGRESVNLYLLAKTIKAAPELIKGSAEALRRLPDALARTRASLTILRRRTVALGLKTEGRFTPEPQIRVAPPPTRTLRPGSPPRLVEGQGRGQVSGTPPTGMLRDVDSPSRSVQVDASHPLLKGNGPANANDPPPPPPRSQAQKVAINAPEDSPHARSIDTTHPGQPRSSQRRDQSTTAMAGKPPSGDKPKVGAPKTSSGTKAGAPEKAMLTEQDATRLRQLAEWEKRGKIRGDVHGLRTRLKSNDPDTLRAARTEFDDASVDIAEGKKPHVENYAEDPRPQAPETERISTGGKKRIDFSGWIKKRLPNGNDQWEYRNWLKTSHKVGSIEHDHPAPGTPAAEALVRTWEEEMGRRR